MHPREEEDVDIILCICLTYIRFAKGGDNMKNIHILSIMFVLIGAFDLAFLGLFNVNVIDTLFGSFPGLENVIYVLIGLSGILMIAQHKGDCKLCKGK
jgi:uncharacterized membrane protein YuzA (DUF378 family)